MSGPSVDERFRLSREERNKIFTLWALDGYLKHGPEFATRKCDHEDFEILQKHGIKAAEKGTLETARTIKLGMCVQIGISSAPTSSSVTAFSSSSASASSNSLHVEDCLTQARLNSYDKPFPTKYQDLRARNESLVSRNDELEKQVTDLEAKLVKVEKSCHQLQEQVMDLKGKIRVFCRVRPFANADASAKKSTIIRIENKQKIRVISSRTDEKFMYDCVFGPHAQQGEIFVEVAHHVESVLEGHRVCIFAYGQTGSGKTHTMIGGKGEDMGIIPRAMQHAFYLAAAGKHKWMYRFQVSIIEVYNDLCLDLLASKRKLQVFNNAATDGVVIPGLTVAEVTSIESALRLLESASNERSVSATDANAQSSRSHVVFQLHVRGSCDDSGEILKGTLNLIDLAGSENMDGEEVGTERWKETRHINQSLSALINVISSISKKAKHIPYKDSKLTSLLADSLSPKSKIHMFINVSPSKSDCRETLCSLRFANRVNQCYLRTAK